MDSVYATEERYREAFNLVEAYIERRYEVQVLISDVTDPFTGDLDGAQIAVDYDQSSEDALFIIVHLFGHTVQWNTDPRARDIGSLQPAAIDESRMADLRDYEQTACRYSLQLLHEAGIPDLDQWVADFAACDWAYLSHFYRTGEKRAFRSFWHEGMPLVAPLPVPEFQPTRWRSRADGVVI
ncbi:MAG: hypothetical protein JWO56_404 [Acidobacteria bacterium]|nr:hypothetical protein [Acidobacteriota bacterium]